MQRMVPRLAASSIENSGQKVLGLPTMYIYKDGEKIDECRGEEQCTMENIRAMVEKYI